MTDYVNFNKYIYYFNQYLPGIININVQMLKFHYLWLRYLRYDKKKFSGQDYSRINSLFCDER